MNKKFKLWRDLTAFLQRKLGKRSEELKEGNRFTYEEHEKELNEWLQLQPDKCCITCQEIKKAGDFGYSQSNRREDGFFEPVLHQRCKPCHQIWRSERDTPCRLCSNKTKHDDYIRFIYGYVLTGYGIPRIQICCSTCEPAFLALPISQQKALIREACDKAYPMGQVIYGLYDPRDNKVRNIGRTSDRKRRLRDHLKSSNSLPHTYEDRKEWYTKSNWIYDLLEQNLEPIMKIIKYVDISPKSPEWERRFILHGIQQGWELLNTETMDEHLVDKVQDSSINFLQAPFEELVEHGFFSEESPEAFVHAWYEP